MASSSSSSFPGESASGNGQPPAGQNPTTAPPIGIMAQQLQKQQSSGTSTPSGLSLSGLEQQPQQDLRSLALQQQLAALMMHHPQPQHTHQQQQSVQPLSSFSSLISQPPALGVQSSSSIGGGSLQCHPSTTGSGHALGGSIGFYQQLAALQHQQQHGSFANGPSATPAVAALPQQFSNALHLQSSPATASVLSPQITATSGSTSSQGGLAALLSVLTANPPLLNSLASGNLSGDILQSRNPEIVSDGNSGLLALAAHLLLQQQQHTQQPPQSASAANYLTASLLQMLNPATATLLAYQSFLQQQQTPTVTGQNAQLQLLLQLLLAGGTAGRSAGLQPAALGILSGNQQQQQSLLTTALAAQQVAQQQQLSNQQEEARLLLEQLIRQHHGRDLNEQQREQDQKLQLRQEPEQFVTMPSGSSEQQRQSPALTAVAVAAFGAAQENAKLQQAEQSRVQHQQQSEAMESSQRELFQQEQAATAITQSAERLLTSEAVQDRISRLISENEAIVEPNPVLLKRRPYQRQGTSSSIGWEQGVRSNSMTSQTSETAGTSQHGSPGVHSPVVTPKIHPATTRSFSLHEAQFLRFGGGSLTSGQPINRNIGCAIAPGGSVAASTATASCSLTCNFCHLKFPNEAGLEAHEPRCSKKDIQHQQQLLLQKQQSQPQLKLASPFQQPYRHKEEINTTSTEQEQQLSQFQQQIKQLEHHQSTIAALVGGGRGVARDVIINEAGRASVPYGSTARLQQTSNVSRQHQSPSQHFGQSGSDSRLKKRGLAEAGNAMRNDIDCTEIDVVATSNPECEGGGRMAESNKMARIELFCSTNSSISPSSLQQLTSSISQQRIGEKGKQQDDSGISIAKQQQWKIQSQTISSNQRQPVLTLRDSVIWAITYSTDLRSTVKMPYFLTLSPAELADSNVDSATGSTTVFRGRTRNITSETFVCLNKVRPTAVEHRGDNYSAYSNGWSVPMDHGGDERLLMQLFLSTHSFACPRDPEYTLAASSSTQQLRTTHSSSWNQQQNKIFPHSSKQQQQQLIQMVVDTGNNTDRLQLEYRQKLEIMGTLNRHEDRKESAEEKIKMDADEKENTVAQEKEIIVSTQENVTVRHCAVTNCLKKSSLLVKEQKRFGKSKFEFNNLTIPKSSRNDEMEIYIRGRGRGRYVCTKCGIRCKKPSMLKKHLRSHTNIRPFACRVCNFSFKTKGNLTKHLVSKSHQRKINNAEDEGRSMHRSSKGNMDKREVEEEDDELGKLVMADEEEEEADQREEKEQNRFEQWDRDEDWDDDDDDDADEDEEDDGSPNGGVPPPPPGTLSYRRFGQENILVERETHTPPTLWTLMSEARDGKNKYCNKKREVTGNEQTIEEDEDGDHREIEQFGDEKYQLVDSQLGWPEPDEAVQRGCHSAPPAALCSPDHSRARKRRNQTKNNKNERNEKTDTQVHQSPLANFIPQHPRQQEQSQQPSLAAQLAVGLLNTAPFHHDTSVGMNNHSQQQHHSIVQHQQQFFTSSNSTPQPSSFCSTLLPSAGLATALKFLESAVDLQATAPSDSLAHSHHTLGTFLATDSQQFQCTLCEPPRKFRKESDFSLHKQAHLIEHQNSRHQKSSFECDMSTTTSSNAAISSNLEDVCSTSAISSITSMLPPPPQQNQLHLRNFICTDCNLGFRSHGVLAKHLRSKNHVKTLVASGKLPEEANHLLVKENSKALASIDAGDSIRALQSTKQLLSKMREQLGLDSSSCANKSKQSTEYQSSDNVLSNTPIVSSTPITTVNTFSTNSLSDVDRNTTTTTPITIPIHQQGKVRITSNNKRATTTSESLPHGLKRKFPSSSEEQIFFSNSTQKDSLPSAKNSREEFLNQVESPLHSLAIIATDLANCSAHTAQRLLSANTEKHHTSFSTPSAPIKSTATINNVNVWVPPKMLVTQSGSGTEYRNSTTPDLHTDPLGNLLSNRSAEENSESTGTRSESSTPRSNAHQQQLHGFSPMPATTRCFCEMNFDTPAELALHFHAFHVVMRHGNDYRCSRRNCGKVFPNRMALQVHIQAHFFGGGATPGQRDIHEEQFQAASCPASPSLNPRQRYPAPSAPPSSSPQSPGAPESASMSQDPHSSDFPSSRLQPEYNAQQEASNSATMVVHCQFCGLQWPDIHALQAHWVKQHAAQLSRPHVCADCDAGFTTMEALNIHRAQHQENRR